MHANKRALKLTLTHVRTLTLVNARRANVHKHTQAQRANALYPRCNLQLATQVLQAKPSGKHLILGVLVSVSIRISPNCFLVALLAETKSYDKTER